MAKHNDNVINIEACVKFSYKKMKRNFHKDEKISKQNSAVEVGLINVLHEKNAVWEFSLRVWAKILFLFQLVQTFNNEKYNNVV